MANRKGDASICAGLLLMAAALCLMGYNLWDAHRAAASVEQIVQSMDRQQRSAPSDANEPVPSISPEAQTPADGRDPAREMPTVEVGANAYIGTLEIPSLERTVPVMSDWSESKLKLAPCRYTGSVYGSDMVIAGHNYSAHFGALGSLERGAAVVFTDVEGDVFAYAVSEVEQISAAAVEEMENGDWDLTLFTCTTGGAARLAVRCERISDGAEP